MASFQNRLSNIVLPLFVLAAICVLATGCGTTKQRLATEQLVMSDAVDNAVSEIDFRPLAGHKVFLDTTYVKNIKGVAFVNADYIVSSLRQQMMAADCWLQETKEQADIIIEARVGTLGSDNNEVVYGLPASNTLSTAASLVPNAPIVPPIPELSLAKKEAQLGAAKVALFAYDRETRRPIWQSGISQANSTAQDVWVFGAGPFQQGTIYEGTQFAGSRLALPRLRTDGTEAEAPEVAYEREHLFPRLRQHQLTSVKVTSFENDSSPDEEEETKKEKEGDEEPEKTATSEKSKGVRVSAKSD